MTDLNREQLAELFNLFHIARSAGRKTRYERMIYASNEFNKLHPEISSTCAYKHLSRSFES